MKPDYTFFVNGKKASELERENLDRLRAIESAGYNLNVMYSCKWKEIKQSSSVAQHVLYNQAIGPPINDNGMTERELLDKIQEGKIDGFLLASAVVPTELRDYFADLPPLFKRVEISREDLSAKMRDYCESHDLLKHPTPQLVTGYHMTDLLYYSHYVRFLLEHGVHFFNVKRFYQYRTAPILRGFLTNIAKRRMEAQAAGNEIKSNNLKLICNSVSSPLILSLGMYFVLFYTYGAMLKNELKHTVCKYAYSADEELSMMGDPLMISNTELGDGMTEFSFKKQHVIQKSPISIGCAVLFISKTIMMRFYYDFLLKHIDRSKIAPCYFDTGTSP